MSGVIRVKVQPFRVSNYIFKTVYKEKYVHTYVDIIINMYVSVVE